MGSLESILDITSAIKAQKRNRKESMPKIVQDLLKTGEKFLDLSSIVKDEKEDKKLFLPRLDEKLFGKHEKAEYNPFKLFSEYISMLKDNLYNYYSSTKKSIKKLTKSIGYKIITEIEDWGNIYYKTAFKRLTMLTPLGAMARYLESLWIYVGKKIK
mgnify:CR=1 FL=1|jgi:hypothetical protein|tara:strand:- start:4235 stop:4705 length:471 start_codon:yes stop_codon:yes gene_type:complete